MVKDPWTKRKKRCKRAAMSQTIGTQTSPDKYIPNQWNPKVVIQQLTMTQSDKTHVDINCGSIADQEICDTVISQCTDMPKLVSRLPNNYNIFMKPITNNEKANSTLASELMTNSESQQSLQHLHNEQSIYKHRVYSVAKRYRPGPKCYKRLHEQFHAEIDIPLIRDDNSNNSPNNSLTVIHEQEEEVNEPPLQMSQFVETNCGIDKEVEVAEILDLSPDECNITEPIEITGLLENPSDIPIDDINRGMVETHSLITDSKSKDTENQQPSNQPNENAGDQKRRSSKTVTFDFQDIRTEFVENDGNEEPTAPNEENDSMEDEDDIQNPLRKRKYIRIFAEKVNIYNHFYN